MIFIYDSSILTLVFFLFLIGLSGIVITNKNIIIILMSIELIFLSVNLNFIIFSITLDDIVGQVFSLFILTIAAAEAAIGLALLIIYYRVRGVIAVDLVALIKG